MAGKSHWPKQSFLKTQLCTWEKMLVKFENLFWEFLSGTSEFLLLLPSCPSFFLSLSPPPCSLMLPVENKVRADKIAET